jgi:hypothetical protein
MAIEPLGVSREPNQTEVTVRRYKSWGVSRGMRINTNRTPVSPTRDRLWTQTALALHFGLQRNQRSCKAADLPASLPHQFHSRCRRPGDVIT